MALISSASYRKLVNLYWVVDQCVQNADFYGAIQSANEALGILDQGVDWPLKVSITNERYVYPANLLLLRAKCVASLSEENSEDVEQSVNEALLVDLKSVVNLCADQPGAQPTYIGATFEFLNRCIYTGLRTSAQNVDFALNHLRYVQNLLCAEDKSGYAVALGLEADLLQKYFHKDDQSVFCSIEKLSEVLEIAKSFGDADTEFTAKARLSRYHLHPTLIQDPNNVEKAISFAFSALSNAPDNIGGEKYLLRDAIGRAYAIRGQGNPLTNTLLSINALELVLNDFSDKENARRWPEIVLFWIDVLLRSEVLGGGDPYLELQLEAVYAYSHGERMPNLLELAERRLQAVVSRIDHKETPETYFDALRAAHKLSRLKELNDGFDNREYVGELRAFKQNVDEAENSSLWIDVDWQISLATLNLDDPISVKTCLDNLLKVTNSHDLSSRPVVYFETHLLIASCFIQLESWVEGYKHIKLAMHDIFTKIETDFRGFSKKLFSLPGGPERIRDIPLAAAVNGDIKNALAYLDINATNSLAFDLEDLFLIDHQVNRRSLMQTYIYIKQGQRLLHSSSDRDYLAEVMRLEQLRTPLENLRKVEPDYLRASIFKNIEKWLAGLDCWVFVPIIGNKISCFLLIPPYASLADVILSEDVEMGHVDLLRVLVRSGGDEGWASIQPTLNKKELHDDDIEHIEHEFDEMCRYLWSSFGGWIMRVVATHEQSHVKQLCCINAGPLGFFPFGMGFDLETRQYLLDKMSIHYAPSLYSLISIKERLKLFRDPPCLAAINGKEDTSTQFTPFGVEFSAAQFHPETVHVLRSGEYTISEMVDTLKSANHWLFSGHANFDWRDASLSKLQFSGGEMPVDLLEGLATHSPLRLVMLTACSTGLQNFMDGDVERFGFSDKFLSLGALGIIVSLWPVQDEAGALITERFYHFYQVEKLLPVDALRKAQLWLRDISHGELCRYFREKSDQHPEFSSLANAFIEEYSDSEDDERHYGDPEFWAGFVLVGV